MIIKLRQSKVAEIMNALGEVGKPGKVEKPIYNGILFEVVEQAIKISATNGIEAVHMLEVIDGEALAVQGTGSFILMKNDFRVLAALKGKISLTIEGNKALVKQGRRKIEFPLLDATQFPNILPTEQPLDTFVLPTSVFQYVVHQGTYAVATTGERPILQGLNLKVATNGDELALEAVSTDSHRVVLMSTGNMPEKFNEVTIPTDSLKMLKTIPNDPEDMLGCAMYKNKLILSYQNRILIILRLLEGKYPECSKLFPTDFNHNIPMDTAKLRETLTLLKLVNNGSAAENAASIKNVVTFSFEGTKAILTSVGKGGIGSFEEEIELDATATIKEPFKIAFTADYLMDVLKHIKTDRILMNVVAPLRPVTICEVATAGEKDVFEETHLVLPVKVSMA